MSQTTGKIFAFKDTIWLGAKHDGYPRTTFDDYSRLRSATAADPFERAALHQSLFTFGVLESVMETSIPESTLLSRNDTGQVVVTDRNFRDLLKDWRSRIKQLAASNRQQCIQWADRVQTSLQQMHLLLQVEIMHPDHGVFLPSGLGMEERASIFCLIACIAEAVVSSRRIFPSIPTKGVMWSFLLWPFDFMEKGMIADGWCPFAIAVLTCEACVLSYASTRRPYIRESTGDHNRCKRTGCIVNTIDTSTYSNKHTEETCMCGYLRPPSKRVVDGLEGGEIPVLRQLEPDGSLVVSSSSTTPYVAISHVWADGLGSVTEKGLPTCQVRRLEGLVRQLIPSGAFWMDALCVPEDVAARTRAIGLMAQTYRNADVVLVIDAGIRSCSLSAPLEEKLLRILSSGWMQRLWTLQEGLLARKLVFEFENGFTTLDELIPTEEDDVLDTLLTALASEIFRLTKYQRHYSARGLRLGDVAQFLRWRTTSKAKDETLAIAGLLDVDSFKLASLPPLERMKTFLLEIQNLPSDIVFMVSPKLSEPGFRWAPETLMRSRDSSMATGEYKASCTREGLYAEYAAVSFAETTLAIGLQWFVRDTANRQIYKIVDFEARRDKKEYSCNVLLMMALPRLSETVSCVACWATYPESGLGEAESRVHCEYRRRLVLVDISEHGLEGEEDEVLKAAKSGRMRVLVT